MFFFLTELAEDGEQYCFQVVFHGINNRTYYLSAESQGLWVFKPAISEWMSILIKVIFISRMEMWMKALTCAGYEYMKLMVAELQRQLDEIEDAKGMVFMSTYKLGPFYMFQLAS